MSQEPAQSPVLRLGREPCPEAAFGRDSAALPSRSDMPPPDNESNKTLRGSCIGGKSILQLLIKSKYPYFQQQEVGLLDPGQRDLFCTALLHSLCSFFHMFSPSRMMSFESSDLLILFLLII